MKKIVAIALTVLILLTVLTGCRQPKSAVPASGEECFETTSTAATTMTTTMTMTMTTTTAVSTTTAKTKATTVKKHGTQAAVLKNLSQKKVIEKVAPLFTEDQKKTGILASVSLAQFLLETGYGQSKLAQKANNCFGMRDVLSDNTWSGSVWDGKSVYTIRTWEIVDNKKVTVSAAFRRYDCIEDSIADHSAYLLNAKSEGALRYEGAINCTDYNAAVQAIARGGYATSTTYAKKLCDIIRKWDLTRFDVKKD